MLTFIKKLRNRRDESGSSFIEMQMSIIILSIFMVIATTAVITAMNITIASNDQVTGTNQDAVMQQVIDMGRDITEYQDAHPDRVITKEAMIREGVVSPSNDLVWDVDLGDANIHNKVGTKVCVAAYSTTGTNYTKTEPAIYSVQWGFHKGWVIDGCSKFTREWAK